MNPVDLKTLSDWCDGALIQGRPSDLVGGISTDSRSSTASDLFVALKGDRFDAHDFLDQVVSSEVAGILISALPKETESFSGGVILVRDTLKALQDVARAYRKSCQNLTVVGVTGSNGKTSTKDFLGAVLSHAGKVNKTAGNLNNHIGVPLTALSTESGTRYGVWEMGMNHSGEIEVLAEIAAPDAAVVTHIGTAHIEHMKTRDAIAEEKSQLPRAVPSSGYCVMPATDDYFSYVADSVACEMIPVGGDDGLVRAVDPRVLPDGKSSFQLVSEFSSSLEVQLSVRGEHMIQNALLAAAVGFKEGLSSEQIAEALAESRLTSGRLEEKVVEGIGFLDDSYNANPDSMKAAIRTLESADVSGKRVAVLGFMGELGEIEGEAHREVGAFLVQSGIDVLVTTGDRARQIEDGADGISSAKNFESHAETAEYLKGILEAGDLVLVKGSRAADMGKVLELIESA